MRSRTIVLTLALCFIAGAFCFAASHAAHMGTWKLNEAKSNFDSDVGKNTTVVYEAAGDDIKVIVDGVDKDGKPSHNEWTGKFDEKFYPVTGDPNSDMRSYKVVDDRTLGIMMRKDGKLISTGTIVVAKDGKSRTVTVNGKNASGDSFQTKTVYDKQ